MVEVWCVYKCGLLFELVKEYCWVLIYVLVSIGLCFVLFYTILFYSSVLPSPVPVYSSGLPFISSFCPFPNPLIPSNHLIPFNTCRYLHILILYSPQFLLWFKRQSYQFLVYILMFSSS
jgi:hypothetical protein